jgi:hypothetical protein
MTPKTLFYVSFAASLFLAASFFIWLDPSKLGPNMKSNQDLKRAGTREEVDKILNGWKDAGVRLARTNLAVDWLFIVAYSTLWITAALYLGTRAEPKLHVPAVAFAAVGLFGAFFDAIENVCLYLMLHGNASTLAPKVCAVVRPLNVAMFFLAFGYMVLAGAVVAFTRHPLSS